MYQHGNLSLAEEWRPQIGAGILTPIGRQWGVLFDTTVSSIETEPYSNEIVPGSAPNRAKETRVAVMPSFVRIWRRDRFHIYAGPGLGWEHRRQNNRLRPIVGYEQNGRAIFSDQFVESNSTETRAMLVFRVGTAINLTDRVLLRVGFSVLPRYADETPSKSVELGIGYRF